MVLPQDPSTDAKDPRRAWLPAAGCFRYLGQESIKRTNGGVACLTEDQIEDNNNEQNILVHDKKIEGTELAYDIVSTANTVLRNDLIRSNEMIESWDAKTKAFIAANDLGVKNAIINEKTAREQGFE